MAPTKQLYLLSSLSVAIRYGFWGGAYLLVLYLVSARHFPLEKAATIYGIFVGGGAFLPMLGGLAADRWSDKWLIFFALTCNALGGLLIPCLNDLLFYSGILFLGFGYGFSVVSLFALLSRAYEGKPHLREGGFSIYYCMGTVAAFFAVIIIGFLSKMWGWAAGWASISIIAILGMAPALYYFKKFPPVEKRPDSRRESSKAPLSALEKRRLFFICFIGALSVFFWAAYSQGWSSMSVFAMEKCGPFLDSWKIPISWVLSLESFFLILLTPLLAMFYSYLHKAAKNPPPVLKMAFSFLAMAACFTILIGGCFQSNTSGAPLFAITGAYFFMALGELLMGPIGFSMVTHLAPRKISGMVMGGWFVTIGLAYGLGGFVAGFFSAMAPWKFFALIALITIAPGLVLLSFAKRLNASID